MALIGQLASGHRQSPWRLKALMSAANRYLLVNQPDDYVPLYRAVYQDFPTSALAPLCHWKVTFQAYLRDQADAGRLLREHLTLYPAHSTTGAALYFLGRHLGARRRSHAARAPATGAWTEVFENHYYAMLARERLKGQFRPAGPIPASEAGSFVAAIKFNQPGKVATQAAARHSSAH